MIDDKVPLDRARRGTYGSKPFSVVNIIRINKPAPWVVVGINKYIASLSKHPVRSFVCSFGLID